MSSASPTAEGPAPGRGLADYGRDGWRLGGTVFRIAIGRRELRRFAAKTFGFVLALELAVAALTMVIRHEGTIPQRLGWAFASAYAIAFLSNMAAVGLAGLSDRVLAGEPAPHSIGWRLMRTRVWAVAAWALAVVAIALPARLVSGWALDQVLAVLLGFGWAVLSFFVVPAIALRGDGAVAAAKRSLALVGRQWGTQVVGMVYVWLRPWAFIGLPGLIALVAGIVLERLGFDFLGWSLALAGVVALAFTYLVVISSNSILSVALFRHAEGDPLPDEFDRELLARVLRGPSPTVTKIVRRLDGERAARLRTRIQQLSRPGHPRDE